jgi:hypothetical protein
MAYNALNLIGDLKLYPLKADGSVLYGMDVINATSLVLKPGKVEIVTRTANRRTGYGTTLNTWVKATEGDQFLVKNDEMRAEMLALQVRGQKSTATRAGATVTDEDVVVAELDFWIPLASNYLADDAVTEKTGDLDEGVHFEVDRRMGEVKFLSGVVGGATKGQTKELTYKTKSRTYTRIAAATQIPGRYAIKLDGINQASGGKDCLLWVPQAIVAPAGGDLELITQKALEGQLQIVPELQEGQSASWYYEEDD